MHPGKEVDEVDQDEIKERNITTEQQHGDDHDERGIRQFLIAPDSFLFRLPGPGCFLQFDLYFGEKAFRFADHFMGVFEKASRGSTGQEGLEPPTDGFGDRYSTN